MYLLLPESGPYLTDIPVIEPTKYLVRNPTSYAAYLGAYSLTFGSIAINSHLLYRSIKINIPRIIEDLSLAVIPKLKTIQLVEGRRNRFKNWNKKEKYKLVHFHNKKSFIDFLYTNEMLICRFP